MGVECSFPTVIVPIVVLLDSGRRGVVAAGVCAVASLRHAATNGAISDVARTWRLRRRVSVDRLLMCALHRMARFESIGHRYRQPPDTKVSWTMIGSLTHAVGVQVSPHDRTDANRPAARSTRS